MSAQTRCHVCGWRRTYRSQKAAARAGRSHVCQPATPKGTRT
ncbi:hypothetical protein ACFP1Z_06690 [Streptomyces gamaensis]|uniref:Uncharacterized protein n=1 Tax=Streptomyces gamaensis TaxID=1763542 RepID=A0ABW0Z0I6_9ACTN